MQAKATRICMAILALVMLAGCSPARAPAVSTPPAATLPMTAAPQWTAATLPASAAESPIPAASPSPALNAGPVSTATGGVVQQLVEKARQDLAQRLGLPASQIVLVEVQTVIWPDKGLGCPQPGIAYIQVPVDGLLIRFRAGGQTYEYHSGGERLPFLCKAR